MFGAARLGGVAGSFGVTHGDGNRLIGLEISEGMHMGFSNIRIEVVGHLYGARRRHKAGFSCFSSSSFLYAFVNVRGCFHRPSTPRICRLGSRSCWRLEAVSWPRFSPDLELPGASGAHTVGR